MFFRGESKNNKTKHASMTSMQKTKKSRAKEPNTFPQTLKATQT